MLSVWKRLSSKVVSGNDHWSYILDEFEIEGRSKGLYHYVHTGGSTLIIPVTSSKKILMINQYRYLNQKESLEFPCGSIQTNITKLENAQKELREETGYSAGELLHVSDFSPYSGVSDEMCSVFIATNLTHSPLPSDETEEFELVEFSFTEINKMISEGVIWDGMSIAAWTICNAHLSEYIK